MVCMCVDFLFCRCTHPRRGYTQCVVISFLRPFCTRLIGLVACASFKTSHISQISPFSPTYLPSSSPIGSLPTMSWQAVPSPLNDDETREVLSILEKERTALFENTYPLITQKIHSVERSFELLGTSAESNRKNLPKKRAQRFLNAAIDHCEELFLLSAFAAGTGLINTFAKVKTELCISKVLGWWDTVSHPPKLEYFRKEFSFKFNNRPTIGKKPGMRTDDEQLTCAVQSPNKRARTLPSDIPEGHGLAYRENTTPQPNSLVGTSGTGEESFLNLDESLEGYRTILKRLYPTHDTQSLLPLSRQQLIALLNLSRPQNSPSQNSPTEFEASPGFQASGPGNEDWGASNPQVEYSSTDPQRYESGNTILSPSPSLQQLSVSQNPSAAASTFQSFEPVNQIDKWGISNSQVEHGRTSLPINSIINIPIPIEYHPLHDSSKTGHGDTMNRTIHGS